MFDGAWDEAREMLHDLKRARCGDDGEYCRQDGCPICSPCSLCGGSGQLSDDIICPECKGTGEPRRTT